MILPGKHLRGDKALLGVGGEVLAQLSEPKTVSELWERILYAIAAIDINDGIIFAKPKR